MYKILKRLLICFVLTAICWTVSVLADRETLNGEVIRFHVVANSDTEEDQQIKLQVRDAVLSGMEADLRRISDIHAARAYLEDSIPRIRKIANQTLETLGVPQTAAVSFCRESFDTRHYDTFSLPAGVYESLRIVIGEGKGRNWWCVSFPALCIPATSRGFEAVAVDSGFSQGLTDALSGSTNRKIRFFALDVLGRLESSLNHGNKYPVIWTGYVLS